LTGSSEKINQLRIDRNAPPPEKSGRLLPGLALLAAAAAAALWAWSEFRSSTVLVELDVARKPASIAAANSVLDASGYVVARREATASSKVTGKVKEVYVEEGMVVTEGQVVAILDDSALQAQLDLAKARTDSIRALLDEYEAQVRNARLNLDRLRDLAARDLTSKASLDAAEATYDELAARLVTGRANVEVAERNVAVVMDDLSNMTIRAPFSGIVVSKNAQPGEMISPISAGGGFTRTGICTIIDTDSLEIEVDVNEAYIQRVTPGQRVSAVLDAYPSWRIPADVIAIVPTADRQKATVRVRIGFIERDERILRDMGVKVAFLGTETEDEPSQEIQGALVSGESIRADEDGDFVWLVRNGAVEKRRITLGGLRDRPQVLVSQGLAIGDTVVRSSESPLGPGQTVETKD
jgi:RND family efflux transporter MFP subunit